MLIHAHSLRRLAAAVILLSVGVAACTSVTERSRQDWQRDLFSFVLPAGDVQAVEIESENGSITVRGTDRPDSIWISGAKLVQASKPEEAQPAFDMMKISVRPTDGVLQIQPDIPSAVSRHARSRIDFVISIPSRMLATARSTNGNISFEDVARVRSFNVNGHVIVKGSTALEAKTVNGGVDADSAGGNISVNSVNGPVSCVMTAAVRTAAVSTTNGPVSVRLSPHSNVSYRVFSKNGPVANHLPNASAEREGLTQVYRGVIGNAGGMVDIQSTNGPIAVSLNR